MGHTRVASIGVAGLFGAVLCLAAPTARAAAVSVRLQPATLTVAPGDTFDVEIAVDPADSVFNAFDAYLLFDSVRVEFVATTPVAAQVGPLMTSACGSRFHLFTPKPTQLDITCSLLCNGVFVNGPGVIYRVKFRAKPVTGATSLALGPATRFFKAGFIMLPLETQGMTLTVANVTGIGLRDAHDLHLEPPFPNPSSGATSVRFAFRLPEAGPARLDVFDIRGRRVAEVPARDYPSGSHSVGLPVRGIAPGYYRVRLSDSQGRQSSRAWVVIR